MAKEGVSKQFTFIWNIENYLSCPQSNGQFLESPTFTSACLNGSQWRIHLYPKGDGSEAKQHVWFCLKNVKLNCERIIIQCKFEILDRDKNILTTRAAKCTLEENGSYDFPNLISCEDLRSIVKMWKEDALTVHCYLTNVGERNELFNICEARSKIGVDRCLFRWNVKLPDSSDWTEEKQFNFSVDSQFEIKLAAPENDVVIKISRKNKSEISQAVNCRITLLDIEEKEFETKNESHLFHEEVSKWTFPSLITKSKLKEKKDLLLKDEFFTLVFELITSNGTKGDKIEKYSTDTSNTNDITDSNLNTVPRLLQDWREIFKTKKHSDVRLKTNEGEIPAHKSVLCARSPVFSTMFDQPMKESESGIVEIPDLDSKTLKLFLEFLYTETIETVDSSNFIKLILAAEKYQVESLKEKCSGSLISVISDSNVCDILETADMIGHAQLKSSAMSYLKANAKRILISSEWANVIGTNMELATEILHYLSINLTN